MTVLILFLVLFTFGIAGAYTIAQGLGLGRSRSLIVALVWPLVVPAIGALVLPVYLGYLEARK